MIQGPPQHVGEDVATEESDSPWWPNLGHQVAWGVTEAGNAFPQYQRIPMVNECGTTQSSAEDWP